MLRHCDDPDIAALGYAEGVLTENAHINDVSSAGSAIAWLEQMAADWRLLDTLPIHERQRLHRVIAALSTADPGANRTRRKIARADRVRQEEALLRNTGIRAGRRRPLVTTPNASPLPVGLAP